MSLPAMSHVMKYADVSAVDYVLLLMIADSVNTDHGNQFWMTAGNLARKSRCGRQKATEALKDFVADGWLEETTPTVIDGKPTGRPGRYRFLFPIFNDPVYDPGAVVSGGTARGGTGVVVGDTGVVRGDTKTQGNPKGTEREPAPPAAGSPDEPQRMIDRPARERFDTSLPSYKLCSYFCAMWVAHTPDAKPNITKKWVEEADRLLRVDKRDKGEVRSVIDWMFTNHERPYYGNTCHAIPTFRKQYLKIRGDMRTAQQQQGNQRTRDASRSVQQTVRTAPPQFDPTGAVSDAYKAWELDDRRAQKIELLEEVGPGGIEEARAAGRLPGWWDEV